MKCTYPIPCGKECQNGSDYCQMHSKALGIKPVKEPKKVYTIPKQAKGKESKFKSDKERKERLSKFYDEMLNIAPFYCQECGEHLSKSILLNPRSVVCHILEKRNFHSVECDPYNILFLCNLHHGRLDGNLERFMKESKISKLIKERVQLLIPLLTKEELAKVSPYLTN